MLDILVDDDQPATRLENSSQFGHSGLNIDSMLQAFGCIDKVKAIVPKGILCECGAAGGQGGLGVSQHGHGKIEGHNTCRGVLLP